MSTLSDPKLNGEWSRTISSAFYNEGIRDICISPGNRNTPLIIAMTSHKGLNCTSHIDERSGAFYALGISKITKLPTVIITTSGTATANLYPAIIEANLSQIPLIILTADRPNNLLGTGENQTIQQRDLYGYQIRYFYDIGLPIRNTNTLKGVLKRFFRISMGLNHSNLRENPPGPVHLNIPFNEPLYQSKDFNVQQTYEKKNLNYKIDYPKLNYHNIKDDFRFISKSKKPLIICGRINDYNKNIISLSEFMGAPILADPLSQIRYSISHPNILSNYDQFLSKHTIEPDFILRIGEKPISKKLCSLLNEWDPFTVFISPNGRFNDNASNILTGDENYLLDIIKKIIPKTKNEVWKNHILNIENESKKIILNNNKSILNGETAVVECIESLNNKDTFFIGNSLPIRDLDLYTSNYDKRILTLANRGASGIDGIVSTALGCASQKKSNTLLLIGDLSLYHDMNGLLAAKRYNINITIVVENNNGGGIFKKISLDKNNIAFNEFWKTPTDLNIQKISELYSFKYYQAKTSKSLRNHLKSCLLSKGYNLIEAIIQ